MQRSTMEVKAHDIRESCLNDLLIGAESTGKESRHKT